MFVATWTILHGQIDRNHNQIMHNSRELAGLRQALAQANTERAAEGKAPILPTTLAPGGGGTGPLPSTGTQGPQGSTSTTRPTVTIPTLPTAPTSTTTTTNTTAPPAPIVPPLPSVCTQLPILCRPLL